ncbi:PDZ domain-containing protein [Alteromonas sp. ASW11-130]|uniref:PDZ domain-containing protein n=1 Tax=Alteromonas sp. ASW11-130 TaxID=3015775 RepID=UPI002242BF02|nr:PDZ domain-containing protein [Alteromonas sp. ASW11-130]MCW8091016.1 PDZ domain-containing protein [Alteromonas sp. ASW11-130]
MHKLAALLILCFTLVLSGCNVANHIRMRFANDDLTANWPSGSDSILIDTQYIGEKPHVYLSLNGQEGFLFLIDSGASISYIMDTPKINALNLDRGFDLKVEGWGDEGGSHAYQSIISDMSISSVSFNNVSVGYLSLTKTPYFLIPEESIIDGVLGHDILRHFVWKFDKQQNEIEISQSSYEPQNGDTVIDFDETIMSKLAIQAEFNLGSDISLQREVLIDTGSRHFFKVNRTYLEEEDISLDLPLVKAADFGLSGLAEHDRVTLPSITIGDLTLTNVKTNLIESEDADDFWVVGSATLNQFVSVIDYQANKLILRPYKNGQFTSRYNLLGLELRKLTSGEFIVRYVMPDLPSSEHDFEVGDFITSINNTATPKISTEEWLKLTNEPGTYKICRKRAETDSQACFVITSVHVPGYSSAYTSSENVRLLTQ